MALINCPECGKQISDRASICIGCGFPIEEFVKEEKQKKIQQEEIAKKKALEYVAKLEKLPENGSICEVCGYTVGTLVPKCPNCADGGRMVPATFAKNILKNKEIEQAQKDLAETIKAKSTEQETLKPFNGIYAYLKGVRREVYCVKCNSSNCSWETRQVHKDAVTTKQVKRNINPMKPLTRYNVKETTILPERNYTQKYIRCNSCGCEFVELDILRAEKKKAKLAAKEAKKANK